MIHSMTGFARVQTSGDWGQLTCELRSVNHRFLELSLKLPEELRELEAKIRAALNARLGRGKIDCSFKWQLSEGSAAFEIDDERLRQLTDACQRIAEQGQTQAPNAADLLKWPGVLRQPEIDLVGLRKAALALLDEGLIGLIDMRRGEGERLLEVMQSRLTLLDELREQLVGAMPELREAIRERLQKKIDELDIEAEPGRLEQELVMQAQKIDIDEELDRLASHLQALNETLAQAEPIGRRLDFLIQECHREANTIGAKSQTTSVSQTSVDMKVAIEQLREQVQNIE